MGRAPCCDKANVKKGPWSPEEDTKLKEFIEKYGTGGNWIALPQKAGLKRCGKSCRLRWLNYLRPNIKHGEFSDDEDRIICTLFASIGSRWSIIAAQLPGRTDNDIKNYWNTKLKKKLLGIPPNINSQRSKSTTSTNQNQHQQLMFSSSPSPATTPKPLFSALDCLIPSTNISQDLFNSTTTTTLFQGPAASSLSNQYQISFGGPEQSCSSSESYEQQQQQQMGFESYLYGAGAGAGAGLGQWGSSEQGPLEYGYEEIKNLISASSNYNNSTTLTTTTSSSATVFVDDPSAGASAGARVGGGGVLYHF